MDSCASRTVEPATEAPAIRSEDLIARIAAGDRLSFALFYDLHAPRVLGLLVRCLRHRADAEDVLQDTFHQLWRSAPQYAPHRSSPEVWLTLIARSRLVDFLRRRRPAATGTSVQPAAPHFDPLLGLAQDEAAEHVHSALARLPAEQRSAISLAFFEGLTHRQVAQRQGIPLGTAKTRILLGIRSLRKMLSSHEGNDT